MIRPGRHKLKLKMKKLKTNINFSMWRDVLGLRAR